MGRALSTNTTWGTTVNSATGWKSLVLNGILYRYELMMNPEPEKPMVCPSAGARSRAVNMGMVMVLGRKSINTGWPQRVPSLSNAFFSTVAPGLGENGYTTVTWRLGKFCAWAWAGRGPNAAPNTKGTIARAG